ncbi:DUF3429 domain-containing protein [Pseudomonas rhodesiae]|uniref:DUF3429 domain-containing protein n=1 Tax=Pseudomonas rhodesiae TaxID=76760 RepID=UPI00244CFF44|nr:DUF3429 domain-containing protein [Pseudomonas rhodesiae]
MPKHVSLLGYGGLFPFIFLALLIRFSLDYRQLFAIALVNYGASILSFVGALHWGFTTWAQEQWSTYDFHDLGEIKVAYPCFRHYWEQHLDVSMPEGARALIPAPWLAQVNPLCVDKILLGILREKCNVSSTSN